WSSDVCSSDLPELPLLVLRGPGLPLPVRRRDPRPGQAGPPKMSWAAHDLEPYVVQRHLGRKIAFFPLLFGSYAPDMFTKWFVYGVGFFGHEVKASNPAQFHRGWPGFGFTHSLVFGALLALIIFGVWRKPVIAYSFLIGHWAHSLTDTGDTVGTMLFFPF